ncbi:MAG: hypothetical protein WAV78_00370 [Xanthobacteraceae bacterium]
MHTTVRERGHRDLCKDHLPDAEFGAAAGVYGGTEIQHRRFTSKFVLNGLVEWPIRLRDVP